MLEAIFYIICFFLFAAGVYFYPKSKTKQNAFLWLPVALLIGECWTAAIAGLFSAIHIPVTLFSMGLSCLAAAIPLWLKSKKLKTLQSVQIKWADAFFGVLLLAMIAAMGYMRFWAANPIIFATIDPAERFGNAMNIAVSKSVITHFPNLYFIQLSGSLFIQSLQPFFTEVLPFRFFEIKDLLNLWFTGALFYAAANLFSKNKFSKVMVFGLSLAFVWGYPWNNQLFGFVYPGVAVNLILLCLIAFALLWRGELRKKPAFLFVALACFGVGICYTLFVPPLYLAAFFAIAIYLLLEWKTSNLEGLPQTPLKFFKKLALTEICVFAIPALWTLLNTFVFGAKGEFNMSNSIISEGAIFRNLFTDFAIYIPFTIFFLWRAAKKRAWDFASIFATIFFLYQIALFGAMLLGKIGSYYYYKLNFVSWFLFLFLACLAVQKLSENKNARRLVAAYFASWLLIAIFSVSGLDGRLSAYKELANPTPGAGSNFQIYSYNFLLFTPPGEHNIINLDWSFIELCTKARELAGEVDEENRIEMVTDDFQLSFWKDALTSQILVQHAGIPRGNASLWIVLPDSGAYESAQAKIDAMPRLFENESGFIVRPE